ncbi:hypothetical protein L1787_11580 [Acuticoccus sp. M5D2P5]|uniref:hypothetical protein n=1 Tax=Acuticoccus kalidii TaxID=2910977 RepID=UPI001F42D25B|nr:hypothetical protein [Acuticoccus kalidii]MCF3934059.1 hypothetical protein [Acuticoccus kalidii]
MVGSYDDGSNVVGQTGLATGGGDTITVTHRGTIVTLGDSAVGIAAISSGGGIARNDAAAVVGSDGGGNPVFTAGTLLGAQGSSDAVATTGGLVTLTIDCSVTTGDATGAGIGAIGIVAQSIGGSGGIIGGRRPGTAIGDSSGGGGGNGGYADSAGVFIDIAIGGKGGDGGNARIFCNGDTALTTRGNHAPSVEFGFRRSVLDAAILRDYLSFGGAFSTEDERSVDPRMVMAGTDETFTARTDTPDVLATLKAGLQLYKEKSWDARVEYEVHAGEDFVSRGGQLTLSYRF